MSPIARIMQACDRLSADELGDLIVELTAKFDVLKEQEASRLTHQKARKRKTVKDPDGKTYELPPLPSGVSASSGWIEWSYRHSNGKKYGPFGTLRWGRGPGCSRYLGKMRAIS